MIQDAMTSRQKMMDDAIVMLVRMRDDYSEPTQSFEASSSTAKEMKVVADGFIAVVTAMVAVIMEGVLAPCDFELDAADRLHKRLSALLRRMTAIDMPAN